MTEYVTDRVALTHRPSLEIVCDNKFAALAEEQAEAPAPVSRPAVPASSPSPAPMSISAALSLDATDDRVPQQIR